jgi:hypothetical protein
MFERYTLTNFKDDYWSNYCINMSEILPLITILNAKEELLGEGSQECVYEEITLKNVTHRIKNIQIEDYKINADVEFLDTPNGNIAKESILSGVCKFGIRGFGSTHNKINEINFAQFTNIMTWDIIPIDSRVHTVAI